MQSTVSRRMTVLLVLPSGSTARSSCRRYCFTCIQFMSAMRTSAPVGVEPAHSRCTRLPRLSQFYVCRPCTIPL
jgi:hypothetical protein